VLSPLDPAQMGPVATVAWFLLGGLAIALLGTRLSRLADTLADATGLGEAVFGALLLGATTSLPGAIASMTAAAHGYAALAVSNAVGGIAAQTFFLVIADAAYRRANLEHAAASAPNLVCGATLIALLALPLLAALAPEPFGWPVHPVSAVIVAFYLVGLRMASKSHAAPAWLPARSPELREDVPAAGAQGVASGGTWTTFVVIAVAVAAAGWVAGQSSIALVRHSGLSETLVGSLLTAVVSSLPELVTAVAAVRIGALTLAVGGIIGGNTFDVLFLVLSDLAYLEGSVYHAAGRESLFLIVLAILMTACLLLGLLRRQRHGPANIGLESVALLVFYVAGIVTLSYL